MTTNRDREYLVAAFATAIYRIESILAGYDVEDRTSKDYVELRAILDDTKWIADRAASEPPPSSGASDDS
jgi:hypothetical protein